MTEVITNTFDLLSSALVNKSSAGRGSNGKQEAYGIKKLRELILELAVRGKLVPQDANDEPASVLLERMAREKARLIKEGAIGKQKELSAISEDEMPFALPARWEVERLGVISHLITKGTTPTTLGRAFVDSGVSFVKVENIDRGRIRGDSISQFIDEATNQALERSQLAADDVLFSIAGTIGKTCIVYEQDLPANTNQALAIIRGTSIVFDIRYLLIQLDSYVAEATRSKARGGAMPNISLGDLTVLVLPVPPIGEQHRIVAKVDELMALCDQLEQQQTNSIEAHQTLVETLLDTLIRTESREELAEPWTRIANHFDTLFTTKHSIEQLKQTILQLAVIGKLVPQYSGDQPARLALDAAGVDSSHRAVPAEEQRYVIPQSWVWMRFAGVGEQRLGKMLDAGGNRGQWKPYLRNTNVQWMRFELDDVKMMRVEEEEERTLQLRYGDLLVCEGGEPGRCAIWEEQVPEMYFQKALHRVRPCAAILPEYLALNLQVDSQNNVLARYFTGATIKHLTGRSLSEYPIPIPPIGEQHRIVAKVDELMVLCDMLRARLSDAQTTQIHLADAIVEQAICDKYKTNFSQSTPNNSTSNTNVAFGGITPPAPLAP